MAKSSKKPNHAKSSAKPHPKKADKPEKPVKKSAPPAKAKPEPKPAAKSAPAEKPAAKTPPPAPTAKPAKTPVSSKASAREELRKRILGTKKTVRPAAFSLDEVREIAQTSVTKPEPEAKPQAKNHVKTKAVEAAPAKPAQPNHVKAASLADILGFNPRKATNKPAYDDENLVDEKFRRYYKLLIELRNHLTGQIDQHTEDTLKRSSKDDAGDLSSYGQHMADAGTDTFDRDFALSMVANEQEALSEIEAAIQRIRTGSYGICEVTQKPIAKERLLAVPFTRYSAEAQKEIERNRYRARTGAGLLGELGEEGGGGGDEGGGDE